MIVVENLDSLAKNPQIQFVGGPTLGFAHASLVAAWIAPAKRFPVHTHPSSADLIVLLSGEGLMRLGDAERPVSAPSLVYVPPGTPHGLRSTISGVLSLGCQIPPDEAPRRNRGGALGQPTDPCIVVTLSGSPGGSWRLCLSNSLSSARVRFVAPEERATLPDAALPQVVILFDGAVQNPASVAAPSALTFEPGESPIFTSEGGADLLCLTVETGAVQFQL